jgi:hypothetical protein
MATKKAAPRGTVKKKPAGAGTAATQKENTTMKGITVATPIDWSGYTVTNAAFNGTLDQAHRLQGILRRARFAAARVFANHAVQGRLLSIPELDALQEAEASGTLASEDTLKGQQQRTDIETAEGAAAQGLVGWDGPGISLKSEGLPADLRINLMVDLKRNAEDTAKNINVAETMDKFDRTMDATGGDVVKALKELLTQPCQLFGLYVDQVLADYCYPLPGVREAVALGTPEIAA